MPDLAAAICTKDNMRTIGRTLDSIADIASRIVVIDSGSTDGTVELCCERGAEVLHRDWTGMIEQRRFSVDQCREHRWVLVLDSDESLEDDLRTSLRSVIEADDPSYSGWMINRKVWFMGAWLHHAFQPEWRLRLVRGGACKVTGSDPHDRLEVPGRIGRLAGTLRHDSWADLQDWASRNLHYASRAAEQVDTGGSLMDVLLRPPIAFAKQYVWKRAFLDGWRGFLASCMVANQTWLKHAFIATARRHENQRP